MGNCGIYRTALSVVLAASLMGPTFATACGFHNYTLQPSFVDRLLGSDEIVLARSAPGNPFQFQAYEALEGTLEGSEIPLLVDSSTRRRFALDPEAAVLFARDGDYGPWIRLAFVDTEMAPIIRAVMAQLPAWETGDELGRFRYFATLLDHPDDRIHKMALRELDQADYNILRGLDLQIDPQRLQARLFQPFEVEFRTIRVLLLGLSQEEQLRARLEAGVNDSIVSTKGDYLGAYATALIELAGPEAVTSLAARYLTKPDTSVLGRELLIEAFALHGETDDLEMQASIENAINTALWMEPALAGAAARQFGARENWALQDVMQSLLTEGSVLDAGDQQDVSQYVASALH